MTLQIKQIVVYNAEGIRRSLFFKTGAVNIITGKSSTGKTALINIIEYCMGSSSLRVPVGPIRLLARYYAVLYQIGEMQILVAKPPPELGASTQSQLFFRAGKEVEIPEAADITLNSNDDALRDYLSRIIGFSPNQALIGDDATRAAMEASITSTRPFLFQDDGIITSKDILFHGQTEHPMAYQQIKDTLPYLLGAIPEDYMRRQGELRILRRDFKQVEKKLSDAESQIRDQVSKARTLFVEAQQVGLIEPDLHQTDLLDIHASLKLASGWKPDKGLPLEEDKMPALRESLDGLRSKFHNINDQLEAAKAFEKQEDEFTQEAVAQKLRLETVELFPTGEGGEDICPLCAQGIEHPSPKVGTLLRRAKELDASLSSVTREKPWMQKHIQGLSEARLRVKSEMRQVQEQMQALDRENEARKKQNDTHSRVSWVLGRISLYLEDTPTPYSLSTLRKQYESLKKKVYNLETLLSKEDVEDRLESILSVISKDMTEWSKELLLEYKDLPHNFDLKRLTVRIDKPGQPIFMNRNLGSTQNFLGCHLLMIFALHKYFIEQGRPVPGFLFLDQPTMGYFPQDKLTAYKSMEGRVEDLPDEDRVAARKIFDFIFKRCQELSPNLQVIVLEHANLGTPEFEAAMIEPPWRGPRALIPEEWNPKTLDEVVS